ncbi:MAG: phenylacetate--CoA ligase [Clostridiales bacterium]|nr:MAG: phenylacetate--CoA ligase [Clostridiales bacterium]
MFFQKDIETMKRKDIEALQLERLKYTVKYCYDNVPFYRKRLTEAGVLPEKIKTLKDIQYIPYTTKTDIRDNYPYGLFAVPLDKIVRIHASSGTTGKPTVVGYTKNDLDMWSNSVARIGASVGVHSGDIAQISFGYGLFTGALGLHCGLEKLGVAIVPISSGNTDKQLMVMQDFRTSVLIATPSYALYLAEQLREKGIDPKSLSLRVGMFGSEPSTLKMRDEIESSLGVFATDNYGLSEVCGPGISGDCEFRCGQHIAEDYFLPEIINDETGDVLEEGEEGELVFTTLCKEGIPLLRYRTRDLTSLTYETCKCGRTHARMQRVRSRSDDMLKIRGVNVFPTQVESVLAEIPDVASHYRMIVTRDGYMDKLEILVELVNASLLERYKELEALHERIKGRLKSVLGLDVSVKLVEPNSIERCQGKTKHVIDLRNNG